MSLALGAAFVILAAVWAGWALGKTQANNVLAANIAGAILRQLRSGPKSITDLDRAAGLTPCRAAVLALVEGGLVECDGALYRLAENVEIVER